MEQPKLRIVFYEDSESISFIHIDKNEAQRVKEILTLLPQLTDWASASDIACHINANPVSLRRTLYKLAGAKRIDLLHEGKRHVVADKPVLLIRRDEFASNIKQKKFLKSPVLIKYLSRPYKNIR